MPFISITGTKAIAEEHLIKKLQTGLYTTADHFVMDCLQTESCVSG